MQAAHCFLPEIKALTSVLEVLLKETAASEGPLKVIHREPIVQGTLPKEIITSRFESGKEVRLFCKYGSNRKNAHQGYHGGVAHEAAVYQHLLHPMNMPVPMICGVYTDDLCRTLWLFLEYLEASVRVQKSSDPAAMGLAAQWIGKFHAKGEEILRRQHLSYLRSYDADDLCRGLRRTPQSLNRLRMSFPWLAQIFERFQEVVNILLISSQTIIHGEYYPKNILYHNDRIYPVDWESTAVGAGEIDLATLIQAWPEHVRRECTVHYQQARWPEGAPADFERSLCAAQLYLHLRWFGGWPKQSKREIEWWLDQAAELGRQLRLI
jgi:hypothetical protein